MQIKLWTLCAVGAFTLSACGDTPLEQALMGAGAGGATALVLDGNLATGVLVGAGTNLAICQTQPERC